MSGVLRDCLIGFNNVFFHFAFVVSAEMPPRMDFRASRINRVAVPPSQPKPTASSSAPATADAAQKPPNAPRAAGGALDENRNPKQTTTGKPAAQQSLAATIIVGNHHQRKASTLSRNNDLLVQSSTETLLDMLRAHAGLRDCSDETATHIHGILTELYTRVKGARGEWRGAVLGALYGLVESTSPRILVSVARVVLVVSGLLSRVCLVSYAIFVTPTVCSSSA